MYLLSAIYISTQCPVHHNKNVYYLYPPYPYPSWYGPYLTCHNINRVLGECWPYKKLANNLISLKNLKMLLTDPLTQGQDWVRGDAIASRKKYFQKSQFYNVEFVYGAVFLVCIISSKKCLNKISCLKAWGQRTHFWHSRVITVYYVHIVHKPNKKIKIHGWF